MEKKKILIISGLILLILIAICLYFRLKISPKSELPKEEERIIIENKKSEEIIKEMPKELVDLNFDSQAKLGTGYQGKYSESGLTQGQVSIFSQKSANEVYNHYIKIFQNNGYQIMVEKDGKKDSEPKSIVAKKGNYLAIILITKRDSQTGIEVQWKQIGN